MEGRGRSRKTVAWGGEGEGNPSAWPVKHCRSRLSVYYKPGFGADTSAAWKEMSKTGNEESEPGSRGERRGSRGKQYGVRFCGRRWAAKALRQGAEEGPVLLLAVKQLGLACQHGQALQ